MNFDRHDKPQGSSGMLEEDWKEAVEYTWDIMKNHPDYCQCRDCMEYEILTEK